MKSLIFLILTLLSFTTFAEDGEKGEKWKENRDKKVERMSERIEKMTKNRDCIKAAATKEAFKECMSAMKADRKEWKHKKGGKE